MEGFFPFVRYNYPHAARPTFFPAADKHTEVLLTSIQRLAGMQDILPDAQRYWRYLIQTGTEVAQEFGFQQIDVPILEATQLFVRGVGTASDFFVNKEMYTIEEEDGESITLRPEYTAGLVRAYIENGMQNWVQPVKLFSFGPIFRRERPQAGRFRQHSQFDVEIMGETDPAADVEVMMLAMTMLQRIGFRGLTFQLNSTGCPICKPVYVEKLRAYLTDHMEKLAPIDQERMRRNPLRILDSKEAGMDALLADAPHIINSLCADCTDHFAELRRLLDKLEQPYSINFRLVRGIDYYVKTVFEVWAEGIGAQAALFGGGRYDGLAEAIGGPHTPGVGFGAGIDRIALTMAAWGIEPPPAFAIPVFIAHFGGETKSAAVALAFRLRRAHVPARVAFAHARRSMKSQMREANKLDARYVLILGESELAANSVVVRPLDGGEQTTLSLAGSVLEDWLRLALGRKK